MTRRNGIVAVFVCASLETQTGLLATTEESSLSRVTRRHWRPLAFVGLSSMGVLDCSWRFPGKTCGPRFARPTINDLVNAPSCSSRTIAFERG